MISFSASVDSPLYILPHSKTMLTLAISHDSQFLSSNQFDISDLIYISASVDSPLYILPHSKTMLTLAISHDSVSL